ncbi:class I SAM-dependent methyltransferase [Leptolyngbya sp. 15MV]|nr:class I SAM-dependent methyltransferase [Leptolyngbya sp. 15MV]
MTATPPTTNQPDPARGPIRSYASVNRSSRWLADFTALLQGSAERRRRMPEYVADVLSWCREGQAMIAQHLGRPVQGLDILEIGVGQLPRQTAYFARHNRVIGIDLDLAPRGIDLPGYWRMLRTNGVKRLAKTIGRKAVGFDRAFERELARQLGVDRLPKVTLLQMDATAMTFPTASFDVAFSYDVFEHLPDPAAVLRQTARVLRPGGVAFNWIHPITAEDGFHDLRIIAGRRDAVPRWAHLRPSCRHLTESSAYLNQWRLAQWRDVIAREMPGATIHLTAPPNQQTLRSELTTLRATGELADFTDEELLAHRLLMCWRKP